jgi:S-adenosylmethionine synthetase
MWQGRHLFTSEAVCIGHPDKLADQISDAVLDAFIAQDPYSRVACETLVTTGMALLAGEVTSKAVVNCAEVVRQVIRETGYTSSEAGMDADNCAVLVCLGRQSSDIALGVDEDPSRGKSIGAGDQGMMIGFACTETPELMPMPIQAAHNIMGRLLHARRSGEVPYLRPDGKCQVTVEYDGRTPVRIATVVLSAQHDPDVAHEKIRADLIQAVVMPSLPERFRRKDITFHINPTGRFVTGGPHGDTGLTGRKIIVDTYGGRARHGGGAFSGKDPTKVDRSASYAMRYAAKNIVAAGLADVCETHVSYAIGVADPISISVDTEGTAKVPEERLRELIIECFDLTPAGIIRMLDLRRPIFRKTSANGHFGHNGPEFTWERTDKADLLRKKAGL